MENKNKALEQLENIHNYMVDNEDGTPLDSSIFLLWAFASSIMFLGFESVLELNINFAILFLVSIIILAFGFELFLLRRENYKYDIVNITHNQIMMKWNYIISIIFAIILTVIFNTNTIGIYSYPSWVFLIAFANFNIGLILNKYYFIIAGIFGLVVGSLIFIILVYMNLEYLYEYYKFISTIACSGSLVYIGIMIKRTEKN